MESRGTSARIEARPESRSPSVVVTPTAVRGPYPIVRLPARTTSAPPRRGRARRHDGRLRVRTSHHSPVPRRGHGRHKTEGETSGRRSGVACPGGAGQPRGGDSAAARPPLRPASTTYEIRYEKRAPQRLRSKHVDFLPTDIPPVAVSCCEVLRVFFRHLRPDRIGAFTSSRERVDDFLRPRARQADRAPATRLERGGSRRAPSAGRDPRCGVGRALLRQVPADLDSMPPFIQRSIRLQDRLIRSAYGSSASPTAISRSSPRLSPDSSSHQRRNRARSASVIVLCGRRQWRHCGSRPRRRHSRTILPVSWKRTPQPSQGRPPWARPARLPPTSPVLFPDELDERVRPQRCSANAWADDRHATRSSPIASRRCVGPKSGSLTLTRLQDRPCDLPLVLNRGAARAPAPHAVPALLRRSRLRRDRARHAGSARNGRC